MGDIPIYWFADAERENARLEDLHEAVDIFNQGFIAGRETGSGEDIRLPEKEDLRLFAATYVSRFNKLCKLPWSEVQHKINAVVDEVNNRNYGR